MVLIASLPVNNPELVRASLQGGADVIKVHINLTHRASANQIGTLAEERSALQEILAIAKEVPCGIVPAASPEKVIPEELAELVEMEFDFLSLYLRDARVGVLPPVDKMERMLALSSEDPLDLAASLDTLDMQVLEASIMHKGSYAQPLTYRDLAQYRQLRQATHLPLVIPSQHAFGPESLKDLSGIGAEAVMLGTIVAGTTPQSWRDTFSAFRQEADRICGSSAQ
jgi:hypothetical protein